MSRPAIVLRRTVRRAAALSLFMACLLAGTHTFAQEPPDCEARGVRSQVYEIRYRPMAEAIQLVDQLLGVCGAFSYSKSLGVVTVEDEHERLERIGEALASWDLPPREVEITVSLILATRDDAAKTPTLVEELRGVTSTLSQVTSYTRFERLKTATVRTTEGADTVIDLGDRYQVTLHVDLVDPARAVVFDPFKLVRLPSPGEVGARSKERARDLLSMKVNLPPEQLHVVGAPSRSRERAIFLALEAFPLEAADPVPVRVLGGDR